MLYPYRTDSVPLRKEGILTIVHFAPCIQRKSSISLHNWKISSIFAPYLIGTIELMPDRHRIALSIALRYLEDRGWSELIDPRWTPDVHDELVHSGLGFTEQEIVELCNDIFNGKADWNSTDRLTAIDYPSALQQIHNSIKYNGFTPHTISLIDNYTNDILNGRTNLTRFNQQEHAGLCTAGAVLIGAYLVCDYARTSLTASSDAPASQASPTNLGNTNFSHKKCVF